MSANLIEKLHPARFSEMSTLMAAIVGYVLGESFTDPTVAELTKGLQSLEDLRNNWNMLLDAAELTDEERKEAVERFNAKVSKFPGTEM